MNPSNYSQNNNEQGEQDMVESEDTTQMLARRRKKTQERKQNNRQNAISKQRKYSSKNEKNRKNTTQNTVNSYNRNNNLIKDDPKLIMDSVKATADAAYVNKNKTNTVAFPNNEQFIPKKQNKSQPQPIVNKPVLKEQDKLLKKSTTLNKEFQQPNKQPNEPKSFFEYNRDRLNNFDSTYIPSVSPDSLIKNSKEKNPFKFGKPKNYIKIETKDTKDPILLKQMEKEAKEMAKPLKTYTIEDEDF